jgi:hypothetical protein
MTNHDAIKRLQNRDEYLVAKIAAIEAEGRSAFWFYADREALAIAIAAIEYVIEMQKYEQSQVPLDN